MDIRREIGEVVRIFFRTYYGRRAFRIFVFSAVMILVLSLSVKFSNIKYSDKIQELERKISILRREISGRDIKKEVEGLEQALSLWEISKVQVQGFYLFLIRLSNSIPKSVRINKIEFLPSDGRRVEFIMYGEAENPRNLYSFSRRLDKKTGDFIVHSEIVRFNAQEEVTEFVLKGYFILTK